MVAFRFAARLIVLIAALALPISNQPVRAAESLEDAHVLVLGRISDDPRAHYEQLKPLLDYVVPRMADVGIREGRILMARDVQQMNSYLRRGRVDWVTETAGTGMLLQQGSGATPLLLTERDGVSQYTTVFFARTELNIATWVHKRLVDVGVMSNLDWQNPQRVPIAFRNDLRIVHETPPYPRALEMVRGDLDPKIKARLREVLVEAANDPDARDAMLRFFKTTRFLPLDASDEAALRYIGGGVKRIRAEVE